MMMLLILTSVLGYELKTAVGTSVFIMTFTALTGALSHFMIGGAPDWPVFFLCVDLHPDLGTDRSSLRQQGKTGDSEPCHRRGARWFWAL